jgi:hypothetical protein
MEVEITTLHPVGINWINHLLTHNFMLQDLSGTLVAVLAFALVLYAPGYLVAYAADLFGFRQKDFAERSLWAIACSFSVVPILSYLVGRGAGLTGINWLLAASAVAVLLLWWKSSKPGWSRRDKVVTALLVCGWIAFVLLMLIDVRVGHKLYFSVVMADQSYRIAFTDAVVRTGIPPMNPLYLAGSPAPMRYYYFWYVLCAAVVKLAHVSARQSFIASSIWAGFGLLVTVKLYTTHFFRWERKQRWIALGLLFVTGADLIPALGNAILQPSWNGDIEWWSVDPISAWPDSLLWVPHHVASALCCLLGFLFLWRTLHSHQEPVSRSSRRWAIALAAFAFASAFGLSIYVAFGFLLLMIAWLVRLALQRHPERTALMGRVAAIALVSALLLSPFVYELAGSLNHAATGNASASAAPASHLFSLSVRRMIDSSLLTGLPVFASWNQSHPVLLDQTIRLLLLLPGLAMELGLYGAVLVLLLLAKRRQSMPIDEARDTSLFFTVCGLVMTLFITSSVISNNDFGYRAVMLPQFFLTLLAADVLGSWWTPESECTIVQTPGRRRLLITLLLLGVAGSVYGAFLLRAWLPIEEARVQNGFTQLPEDAFQIREAFAALDHVAPEDTVVAFRPVDPMVDGQGAVVTPIQFYQRMLVMDASRQILNAERDCAFHFGGDPSRCAAIQDATAQLYASPSPSVEWAQDYCSRFGVQYLLIGHRDPDWSSDTGWPMTLPIVAQQPGFRILQCGEK